MVIFERSSLPWHCICMTVDCNNTNQGPIIVQSIIFMPRLCTTVTNYQTLYNWSINSSLLQVCVQDFCEELEYWGLDDLHMEPCCQHTYYRQVEYLTSLWTALCTCLQIRISYILVDSTMHLPPENLLRQHHELASKEENRASLLTAPCTCLQRKNL